jgi:hypothetical protein
VVWLGWSFDPDQIGVTYIDLEYVMLSYLELVSLVLPIHEGRTANMAHTPLYYRCRSTRQIWSPRCSKMSPLLRWFTTEPDSYSRRWWWPLLMRG